MNSERKWWRGFGLAVLMSAGCNGAAVSTPGGGDASSDAPIVDAVDSSDPDGSRVDAQVVDAQLDQTSDAVTCQAEFYRDQDGDGHGDASESITGCTAPAGYVSSADDCNDQNQDAHPGAEEVCDGVDNDCDGNVEALGSSCRLTHAWSLVAGGSAQDEVRGLVSDSRGNTVVLGEISGGFTLGGRTFASAPGFVDVVLACLSPTGDVLWSRLISSGGYDYAFDLEIDEDDNLYVSTWVAPAQGLTVATASIEGAPSPVTGVGLQDGLLVSYSGGGDYRWHRVLGNEEYDLSGRIARIGDRLLVGGMRFVNGLAAGHVSAVNRDTGAVEFTRTFESTEGSTSASEVTADADRFYVAGSYLGTLSFGSTELISAGSSDVFIGALALDGSPQWARQLGSAGADGASVLTVNPLNNDIVLGFTTNGQLTVPGDAPTALGGRDIALAAYNNAGTLSSLELHGGTGADQIHDLAFRANGSQIMVGSLSGSGSYLGGNLSSSGNQFVAFAAERTKEGDNVFSRVFDPQSSNQNAEARRVSIGSGGLTTIGGVMVESYDFVNLQPNGATPVFGNWFLVAYHPRVP